MPYDVTKRLLLNPQGVHNRSSLFVNRVNNILLGEDNEDDVFLLQEAFKKAGTSSQLHAVSDGFEVLAYLKGDGAYRDRKAFPFPEILLLDLNMPRMNGFEVLEWVRRDPRCRRMIVHILTASPREADIQRAHDLCANSYIIKPTRMEELVAFVTAMHQWHRFTAFPRC
jgi:CheY-like chemotaxis protein